MCYSILILFYIVNNDFSYFKRRYLHFHSIFAFTSVQLDSECYSESQLYLYGYRKPPNAFQ